MRLLRLSPKNAECWAHIPALRQSIEEAGVAFKQKAVNLVVDRIIANFVMDGNPAIPQEQQNSTAVWYLWDDAAGRLRGHLVAIQGDWDGESVVFVWQMWMDRISRTLARDPEVVALQDTALLEMEHYGRSRGANRLVMYTLRPARYWGRRYAFALKRFMYEKALT